MTELNRSVGRCRLSHMLPLKTKGSQALVKASTIHVSMDMCACVCVRAWTVAMSPCVCMCACMDIRTLMCVHVCACMHACAYVNVCLCVSKMPFSTCCHTLCTLKWD